MHEKNTIEILSELVAIESISSDQGHQEDVMKSAQYVEKLFLELGLETKIATSGNSRPAVLAQTAIDPQKKTVLLYAHHDVQPVGDIDKWKTEPFTPQIIDGRLYGRGSGDNKAGVVTHYEVVKALQDNLPVNIKVFIEGEEEIGRRRKVDGRKTKREGRRKKEEGRRKKSEGGRKKQQKEEERSKMKER